MSSLTSHARSSVIWNTGFNLFRDLVQFIQMLILARILVDEDYGKFMVVTSIIGFLSTFSFKPFVAFSLQVQSDEEAGFQNHFSSGVLFQIGIFVITNVVALGLAQTTNYVGISLPLHFMSITFLLEWPTEIRLKMLERAFDWKMRRLLHGLGLIIGLAAAIAIALAGYGVYALLLPGMLVTLPFIYDLFCREGWRPTWQFSWAEYKPAAHFGAARLASSLTSQGRTLLESTVLAAAVGFGPLGVLNRAIGLSQIACGKIAIQLMYSIYPVLTRLDTDSGQSVRAGNVLLRIVGWFAIPTGVVLAWLVVPVVNTIYGPSWSGVIPLMQWTLVSAIMSALVHVGYTLALARDCPRECLASDASLLVGTTVCLGLLLPFGIVPYLCGVIATNVLVLGFLTQVLIQHQALSPRGLLNAALPPIVASAIGVAVAVAITHVGELSPNSLPRATLWGTLFSVTYLLALRVLARNPLSELVALMPGCESLERVLRL